MQEIFFILIVIILFFGVVRRFLFFSSYYGFKKAASEFMDRKMQEEMKHKKEGTVFVSDSHRKSSGKQMDEGEYVDYEEIK